MPVDPNALASWANAITVGRLVLSPVMFLVIPDHNRGSWLAFLLWFILCVSDGILWSCIRIPWCTRHI